MTQPGMFLSQPPIVIRPSKPWQPVTVSMESAMTSRETREYFMPSVPMEMPSEIVMVLNITAFPPAALVAFSLCRARSLMCMLQGVTMAQVDAMPIWGFLKSSSVKPTGWSMAREGARSGPSTTLEEYFLFVIRGILMDGVGMGNCEKLKRLFDFFV